MKWIDYRAKLGVGFSDKDKFVALKNKIYTFVGYLNNMRSFEYDDYDLMCFMLLIGGKVEDYDYDPLEDVQETLDMSRNMGDLISKYVAFCNSYLDNHSEEDIDLLAFIKNALDDLSISYDLLEDEDGSFIFPKGAKELDDALVSEPLEWLGGYPKAHSAFVKALKEYADATDETASETADKFRKALEAFMQEFFGGGQSLENYKSAYGDYLKSHDVPKELANDFAKLLTSYTNFMNNYAKHHDKTNTKVLEYIMYQTGNIIRLLITLKQEE